MQLGPGSRSAWASGSGSMRLSITKDNQPPTDLSRNKFSMLNTQDSGPASIGGYPMQPPTHEMSFDTRRGPPGGSSRSMGMPGRGSRGPSADERKRAVEAVRQTTKPNGPLARDHVEVGGPAASMMGPPMPGRPVPEKISEVNYVLEQSKQLRGLPDRSTAEVEKQAKLLLDEFLNDGNEKVNIFV
jgi:hypothetical protein